MAAKPTWFKILTFVVVLGAVLASRYLLPQSDDDKTTGTGAAKERDAGPKAPGPTPPKKTVTKRAAPKPAPTKPTTNVSSTDATEAQDL